MWFDTGLRKTATWLTRDGGVRKTGGAAGARGRGWLADGMDEVLSGAEDWAGGHICGTAVTA